MLFVMLGLAVGALYALLRYPFLPLLPMGVLLAAGAVLMGIVCGTHPGLIAAEVIGCIAAPQFAFVSITLADQFIRSTKLVPQVQAAIGKQLRRLAANSAMRTLAGN
jgi:hypothetical protein